MGDNQEEHYTKVNLLTSMLLEKANQYLIKTEEKTLIILIDNITLLDL